MKYIAENLEGLFGERYPNDIIFEVIKITKCNDEKHAIYAKLVNMILEEEDPDKNVLTQMYPSRLLKSLIKTDDTFAELMQEKVKEKQNWAARKGSSFVILALLETEATAERTSRELVKHLDTLAVNKSISGVELIINTVNKLRQ